MYRIITIERQYATGGNEIGKRIAAKLGYHIYDRNILVEAAKRLEIPPIYIEELEETSPGSIIFNLSQTAFGGSNKDGRKLPLAERLFWEEKKIIEERTAAGSCIIVGRCAGHILSEHKDCLKVFIHADKELRLKRAIEHEKIAPKDAEAVLKKSDRRRSSFYTTHTGQTWGDPSQFDICLDSGSLGLDACVQILLQAVGQPLHV